MFYTVGTNELTALESAVADKIAQHVHRGTTIDAAKAAVQAMREYQRRHMLKQIFPADLESQKIKGVKNE